MLADIIMLIVSLGVILLSSVVFTNGIELMGHRCGFHQGVVGSILAAVGTALPETIIPVIAILFFKNAAAHEIGIGAIAGAPFMLATLAFFITGIAVLAYAALGRRTRIIRTDLPGLTRDLTFFILLYTLAILASLFTHHHVVRWIMAGALVLGYGWYIVQTLHSEGHEIESVDVLHFNKYLHLPETGLIIAIQLVISLILMTYGAHLFVHYVSSVSLNVGISAMILSIIITPIATELPEKCNSVIWMGKRKDILAIGNITGAMVFQSSFPVAFGVAFTAWDLTGIPMISALLTLASALVIYIWVRIKKTLNPYILLTGGLFYLIFMIYLLKRNG